MKNKFDSKWGFIFSFIPLILMIALIFIIVDHYSLFKFGNIVNSKGFEADLDFIYAILTTIGFSFIIYLFINSIKKLFNKEDKSRMKIVSVIIYTALIIWNIYLLVKNSTFLFIPRIPVIFGTIYLFWLPVKAFKKYREANIGL